MYGILDLTDLDAPEAKDSSKREPLSVTQQNLTNPLNPSDALSSLFDQKRINPRGLAHLERKTANPKKAAKESIRQIAGKIETLLVEENCKPEGLCPTKRAIYDEAFNEVIRQITLESGERGVLLADVKSQIDYALNEFESLFQSAGVFTSRRQVMAEKDLKSVEEERRVLEQEEAELKNTKVQLTNEIGNLNKQIAEMELEEEKRLKADVDFLSAQNEVFRNFCDKKANFGDLLELKRALEKKTTKL